MKPTIGRIVLYKPTTEENEKFYKDGNKSETLPGIIVGVWGEDCVNIQLFTDTSKNFEWKTSILKGEEEGQWSWPAIKK
jgi:hypothetical protein